MQMLSSVKPNVLYMLGSKDLVTNVFRTLMCIVGKSWSKRFSLYFRLAQSMFIY